MRQEVPFSILDKECAYVFRSAYGEFNADLRVGRDPA